MMDESKHLSRDERLDAENQFLKLKLMAEYGGEVHKVDDDTNFPTEIENQFLSNVIEFEKQFASGRTISVFEKVGSPQHFKPVSEVPEQEIEQAWDALSDCMSEHGVELSACSPNVSARELYRFTIEELFKQETDDINIPGMMTCFIYDEFYPDHEYDNTRAAVTDCLSAIFCKEPFEWMHHFAQELRFNNHPAISRDEFKDLINRFKDLHDEIEQDSLDVKSGKIEDKLCPVKGSYVAHAKIDNTNIEYKGNWLVEFGLDADFGYWYIKNVQIEGVAL
jgi:hypothetical protein